jgi:hypothetical protein
MVALRMLIFSTLLIVSSVSNADVLFDGYSKIMLNGAHVGYAVSRYDFDVKKQEFVSTYFIRLDHGALKFSESLKARANSKFEPISYFYTRLDGEPAKTPQTKGAKGTPGVEVKTIDAYFKNNAMSAVVRENGQTKTIKKDIPKGAFLSTFLFYLILQSKEGMKLNANFNFEAVAEEDASLAKGTAFFKEQKNLNGVDTFRVLNMFKGDKYVSWVTPKGEVIATESPDRGLSTQLVANMQEAIGKLAFKPATLESLFGAVPKGKENVLARTGSAEIPAPSPKADEPAGTTLSTQGSAPAAPAKAPAPTGTPKK